MNTKIKFALLLSVLVFSLYVVNAQAGVSIECGAIVEDEVTESSQFFQEYILRLEPGDRVNFYAVPIGDIFAPEIFFYDPNDEFIDGIWTRIGGTPVSLEAQVSATGIYTARVHGPDINQAGAYTLYVNCTLNDGTVIEAGSSNPVNSGGNVTETASTISQQPQFSGFGFPGLPPVDFSTAFRNPLTLGTEITAEIPIAGEAILGYTFDGTAEEAFTLNFGRNSGNLNLGLVVLSANNEVAFQASLVNSNLLVTNFTLPSTGQYTIGVFRIDLVPVENPQPTQFRLSGTLG